MLIPHLGGLPHIIPTVAAIAALAISVWSVRVSYRLHSDSSKTTVVEKQYNAFNELALLRVEHPEMNHLFEVPENYWPVFFLVKETFCGQSDTSELARATLKERSIAMYIFQVFEHTYYQYLHAQSTESVYRARFLEDVLEYFTGRLLRNPRLAYYWSATGGNLCVFFEAVTRDYYDANLQLASTDSTAMLTDSHGPFLVSPALRAGEPMTSPRAQSTG